jgi:two-component system, response regulator, stage 0 sporulation protein F
MKHHLHPSLHVPEECRRGASGLAATSYLSAGPPGRNARRGEVMSEPAAEPPLVVLIEDEPEVLTTLSRQCQHILPTATIIAAPTPAAALSQIAAQPVTLAVLDYYLPGQTGVQVVAVLKEWSPQVRTILITASPTREIEQAARAAGVDILLPKPFLLEELEQAIRSLLPNVGASLCVSSPIR